MRTDVNFRFKLLAFFITEKAWLHQIVKTLWVLLVAFLFVIPIYIYLVVQNPYNWFGGMPGLNDMENPENDLSSELISADGILLGRYVRYHRSKVTYDELPPVLVKTLIISEDHRFFQHSGMDFWSYLRVARGIITFNLQGGGSTITQQTAKNLFHTRDAELQGKLAQIGWPFKLLISKTKEWIIAVRLERSFTKEEIIALYLNTVPFNNNAYGIKVATETYFNKPLKELNVQEAALLVGMLQGTSAYNPVRYPERALKKRNEVLHKLYVHQYIKTMKERDSLRAVPLQLNFVVQNQNRGMATYFRSVLKNELLTWCKTNGYDLYDSGLKIYTTIDSRMQHFAETAMNEHMERLQGAFDQKWGTRNPWVDQGGNEIENFLERKIKRTDTYKHLVKRYGENSDSIKMILNRKRKQRIFTWNGERDTLFSSMDSLRHYNLFLQSGLMAMNPSTGEIKAWVGGIQHKYFKFDHVRQAKRQPGSTFKSFVYGKAMEDGYSPCDVFTDASPVILLGKKIYQVRNFNGTHGDGNTYTLRQAFAKSLNTITIQMMERLKPVNVAEFAQRLGIKSKLQPVYALGLGTSDVSLEELVTAYCSFINSGVYTQPYYITRIEDKHGNVIQNFTPVSKQVIHENTAYKMVHMLKGGIEEEGGSLHALSYLVRDQNEIGGKTGTTNNASDGWYIGITHNLVTGVWVGGDEPSIHFPSWEFGSGSRTALPLWDLFMQKVYAHPEVGYQKGNFKPLRSEADMAFDCSAEFEDDY